MSAREEEQQRGRLQPSGNIRGDALAAMQRRTRAFAEATAGTGKPMVYGAGKGPVGPAPKLARKRRGKPPIGTERAHG